MRKSEVRRWGTACVHKRKHINGLAQPSGPRKDMKKGWMKTGVILKHWAQTAAQDWYESEIMDSTLLFL